jgi:hypothetical protein
VKAELLFLDTIDDLEHRLATWRGDEYSLVRTSFLLRHLLLDDVLVDANRHARTRMRFLMAVSPAVELPVRDGLAFAVDYSCLSPESAPTHWTRQELNLDKFLKTRLIRTAGNDFTVRDLISVVANKLGGAHHGATGNDHPLVDLADTWSNGLPVPLRHIEQVARCVLSASAPLRELLAARSL